MDLDELTDAERRLWEAFPVGDYADLRSGDAEADDPALGPQWDERRTVRAEVIKALLLGAVGGRAGHAPALRLTGARVVGVLDLDYTELHAHVRFAECSFADHVFLYGAHTRQLSFRGSHLVGLDASLAAVDGNLRLMGCRVEGTVKLVGAKVGGSLQLDGSTLINPGGTAISAGRLRVEDDVSMRDGFSAEGECAFNSARIGGNLAMQGARLHAAGQRSCYASRIVVDGDLLCDEIDALGEFRMAGAQIAGLARFAGASLCNPGATALYAYQAVVGANLQCYEGFRAEGDVRLGGMRVAGDVRFDGAVLDGGAGSALDARGLDVGGKVLCRSGFTARGTLQFSDAKIRGALEFRDASLTGIGTALALNKLTVGELYLRFTTVPTGRFNLGYAAIGLLADVPDPETWPVGSELDGLTYDTLQTDLRCGV